MGNSTRSPQWLDEFDRLDQVSRAQVGGKAYHLILLQRWGAQVPRFGVVTTAAFDEWRRTGLLPQALVESVTASLAGWKGKFFAVRSSMTAEDGESNSYAGVMETFLYVTREELAEKIVECFRSADSDRAREYRARRESGSEPKLGAAVVIQEMVASARSGVAFSRAPIGNSALVYVEAGYGLGEGVVSGQVEVDAYWWDRFGNEIRRKIEPKESQITRDSKTGKGTCMLEVPVELKTRSVLSHPDLEKLTRQVVRLEAELGSPADVEWAIDAEGELYILQVRPITQKFAPLGIYADTNLSESYPGLTSPFTADFVAKMYTKVFIEAAESLGYTRARRALLRPSYETLIQGFGGHLYYHLNSYYTAIYALPGGKKTIEAWHRMIGGGMHAAVEFQKFSPLSLYEKLRMAASILKLALFHGTIFGGFCREAAAGAHRLETRLKDLETGSSRETVGFLMKTIDEISGWGLPAVNDLFVMTGLKLLTGVLERSGQDPAIVGELLCTEAGVESMRPLQELRRICARFNESSGFLSALERAQVSYNDYPRMFAELGEQGYADQVAELERFLESFGDRAFEELKIECMTFKQSPESFIQLVLWMAKNPSTSDAVAAPGASEAKPGRFDRRALSWIDRALFPLLRCFTEKAVAVRESTRLLRGQYFGWVRRAILQASSQLMSECPELFGSYPQRAFFGISHTQWQAYGRGELSQAELAAILRAQASWDQVKTDYPELFAHPRGDESSLEPYFLSEENDDSPAPSDSGDARVLQGVGAAPGKVRAKALVLTDPREAMSYSRLSEWVLVTRSTDPAWIFIMSQCAGLVSEKGSLLSHTAIIGRELGIPTVVGVPRVTRLLKTGDLIEIDGKSGQIEIVPEEESTGLMRREAAQTSSSEADASDAVLMRS